MILVSQPAGGEAEQCMHEDTYSVEINKFCIHKLPVEINNFSVEMCVIGSQTGDVLKARLNMYKPIV